MKKAIECMKLNLFAPVFEISSVTGVGLDLLREFIKKLTIQHSIEAEQRVLNSVEQESKSNIPTENETKEKCDGKVDHEKLPSEFYLDDVYLVQVLFDERFE